MNASLLLGVGRGLALAALMCGTSAYAAAVTIEVDARRAEPMPQVLRAGVFTFRPQPPAAALDDWLAQAGPGVVEIDLGAPVFQEAADSDDVIARLRRLLPMLKSIRGAGGEPVLAISRIPLWLSSRPHATEPVAGDVVPRGSVVAPRDGAEWSALVARVVAELRANLGRTPDIEVGWEPDQPSWQGSEADFYAFYRDTVRGVRSADASARVGGPAVSALFNGKGGEDAPAMLPRFLAYCARTPLPELGLSRLPLDFVVWHQFATEPSMAWRLAANQLRAWLRQAGYPPDTELLVGEWASWADFPNPASPEHDQPAAAAYAVATLAAMRDAGIQRAAFTSLMEQREVDAQPFIGSFGVYTNQFIKKPVYWGFAALRRLGPTLLGARSSEPGVAALAGRAANGELSVLVAAPLPSPRALQRTVLAHALAAGIGVAQLRREIDVTAIERLASGQLDPAQLDASEALRNALAPAARSAAALTRWADAARGHGIAVDIVLTPAPLDATPVELWRIDSAHANAWALRERIAATLQQRLTQEKQGLAQGLTERLRERGYRDDQIDVFRAVMNASDREAALGRLPIAQRVTIRAMADESQLYIYDRLARVGREINAWPQLQFGPDGRGTQAAGGRIRFEMEPDSIVLVVVGRR